MKTSLKHMSHLVNHTSSLSHTISRWVIANCGGRPSLAVAHYYLGYSLMRQGRLDVGLDELLKARELDPLSPTIARGAAIPYYLKRDHVRALELLRQSNELGPPFTSTWEIGVYVQN